MSDGPPMMIDVEKAWEILHAGVRPLATERLPLRAAAYRTLAQAVAGDVDYPPFDRSLMDGYALRAADVAKAPVTLRVVGQIAAGVRAERVLGAGEAMQINTGAPIPHGADAVVRVEDTAASADGASVQIRVRVEAGHSITRRAAFGRAGEVVLPAGAVLTPVNVGVAATAGAAEVTVYRRPRVGLLSTGDELVDVGAVPVGAQIRNSNQYMLEALVRAAHAEAVWLGTARDDRDELRKKMGEGLACDVLCLTGGVSMGAFDFVPEILRAAGARIVIEKMKIKPGRPVVVGVMPGGTLVFALPGNPMSAWVGFELLVRPALAGLQGRPGERPVRVTMRLGGKLPATRDRRSYFPARAGVDVRGLWSVVPLDWHGSGDSLGAADANALVMRPPNSRKVGVGDLVQVHLTERV